MILKPLLLLILLTGLSFTAQAQNCPMPVNSPPGTLDSCYAFYQQAAFPISTPNAVNAINVQPDGKAIITGTFSGWQGGPHAGIVRLDTNGNLDPTYDLGENPPPYPFIYNDAFLQADGKLVTAYYLLSGSGAPEWVLSRRMPNGSRDTSFQHPYNDRTFIQVLGHQADGRILVGGIRVDSAGTHPLLDRLLSNGRLDTSFHIRNLKLASSFGINAILALPDGKILLGGDFDSLNGSPINDIIRVHPSGQLDTSFAPVPGTPGSFTRLADGSIIVCGSVYMRLFPTGVRDTTFPRSNIRGGRVVQQPDGRLLLLSSGNLLRRTFADGSIDSSFMGTYIDGYTYTLALEPTGKVLVGGFYADLAQPADINQVMLMRYFAGRTLFTAAQSRAEAPLIVYPIPAKGSLSWASPTRTVAVAMVFSCTGQVMHTQSLPAGAQSIPLPPLPAGLYSLQLGQGSPVRFVVE